MSMQTDKQQRYIWGNRAAGACPATQQSDSSLNYARRAGLTSQPGYASKIKQRSVACVLFVWLGLSSGPPLDWLDVPFGRLRAGGGFLLGMCVGSDAHFLISTNGAQSRGYSWSEARRGEKEQR